VFVLITEIIPAGSGIGDRVTIPDMKMVPFGDTDIVMKKRCQVLKCESSSSTSLDNLWSEIISSLNLPDA
jgi:hypothetical protein